MAVDGTELHPSSIGGRIGEKMSLKNSHA